MTNKHIFKKAYAMALATLQDRYTETGIQAGKKHFSDLWIRDGCFASLGALSVGDVGVVKSTILTMLKHQNESGQIPLRVGQKWFLLKYLGFDAQHPQARFSEDKGVSVPTDGNSLLMIILKRYIQRTQDKSFLIQHFQRLKKAMAWNFSQDINNDLLIEEGYYSGWADSVKKSGTVLYTNVLHYESVNSFAYLCDLVGKTDSAAHYRYLAGCIKITLNKLFWNGKYFVDWIHPDQKVQENFSTDGNVFAILFGLATIEQGKSIQKFIHAHAMDSGFSTQTVFPNYSATKVYGLFHLVRIQDYHNGLQWLWIGCVDAVTKYMLGMKKEAEALLLRMAQKIVEYDGVFEVYDNGIPVKRLFYKSEYWFAWSAGLFVWACHETQLIR